MTNQNVSFSPNIPMPDVTFKEAMVALRVSRSTIYRFIDAGKLTKYKVGSSLRFLRSELEAIPQLCA